MKITILRPVALVSGSLVIASHLCPVILAHHHGTVEHPPHADHRPIDRLPLAQTGSSTSHLG